MMEPSMDGPPCLPTARIMHQTKWLLVFALFNHAAAAAPVAEKLPAASLTELWQPVPAVVASPAGRPPGDAIMLFDGQGTEAWSSVKGGAVPWRIEEGALVVEPKTGDIRTNATFGDIQLHLEFRTPAKRESKGQGRGNSGVFFMGRYELQILDSVDNPTYVNGQGGAIYKQHPPLVNASRPGGEWQTYDVVWIAPRFAADGKLTSPARMTVFLNGVLVQHDSVLTGPTLYRGAPQYVAHEPEGPLTLQDHQNPTAFRNIWVRKLVLPPGS